METKPAPPPLLLVQAFVNTWEADRGIDLLGEPATAASWLRQAGLWDSAGVPTAEQLAVLREVRESIRALLDGPPDGAGGPGPIGRAPGDLTSLHHAADRCRARLTISPTGEFDLTPATLVPLERTLFRLLLVIRDAQKDGTWTRLKTCHNDECRWAFYDRSHSHRGKWCDMAVCGNRVKNRNLRARQR
jgi:predicted RNA-binding Zn ribbon-like protein